MASSCTEMREVLLGCLADSDCIEQGRSIKQCLEQESICKELRTALFLCKRGQVSTASSLPRGPLSTSVDGPSLLAARHA